MTTSTTYTHLDSGGGVPATAARAIADVAAGTGQGDVPARVLEQSELMTLAASIAAQPERWQHLVAFDGSAEGTDRHYACLSRDEFVDVWLLCWTPVNDTGWHDHDLSSGAVAVASGRLVEGALRVGRPEVSTEIEAGRVYSFGADHIHRMSGLDEGSVSIHAYSPPLQTLGQYTVDDDGVLHRTSVHYTDELRVLDQASA
jgi:hypothetical protein